MRKQVRKRTKRVLAAVMAAALMTALCGCAGSAETDVSGGAQTTAETESGVPGEKRDPQELLTKELFAMDTYMSISAYGEDAPAALEEAGTEILRLDALLAAEQEDSEIARINRSGGGRISADTAYLVERAMQIHDDTDGAFEITVYPLKELWGFTSQQYRVPSGEEIRKTLEAVGTDLIGLQGDEKEKEIFFKKEGVRIDLGGIAKGYASSRVAEIFAEHGVSGMINLGGNVQAVGTKPDGSGWRVAIRKPEAEEEGAVSWIDEESEQAAAVAAEDFIGILETSSQAIITSGGYERYFEQDGHIYHHILDSSTGYPSESDLISATVVSEDGTLADALSTSIFVMGLEKASEYWRSRSDVFDMVAMNRQGELYATEGLRGRFSSGLAIHWIGKEDGISSK